MEFLRNFGYQVQDREGGKERERICDAFDQGLRKVTLRFCSVEATCCKNLTGEFVNGIIKEAQLSWILEKVHINLLHHMTMFEMKASGATRLIVSTISTHVPRLPKMFLRKLESQCTTVADECCKADPMIPLCAWFRWSEASRVCRRSNCRHAVHAVLFLGSCRES